MRLLETQTFEKKGSLSSEEMIFACFSCTIEHDNYQGTFNKGPQGILAITLEAIGSLL